MKLFKLVFVAAFIVAEFAPGGVGRSCQVGNGYSYDGTLGKGFHHELGPVKCRTWKGTTIVFNPADFHCGLIEDAHNYCRNPKNSFGPWCYFDDRRYGSIEAAACDLPRCTGLCQSGNGLGYLGPVNMTKDGKACLNWEGRDNKWKNGDYSDLSKKAAKNYCRNPDNDPRGPWCYHGSGTDDWWFCNVPPCTGNCQSGNGVGYTGKVYKTKSGKQCKPWKSHADKPWVSDEKFPDGSTYLAYDYCRNPNNDQNGPWCYIDNKAKFEYCKIPKCYGDAGSTLI